MNNYYDIFYDIISQSPVGQSGCDSRLFLDIITKEDHANTLLRLRNKYFVYILSLSRTCDRVAIELARNFDND